MKIGEFYKGLVEYKKREGASEKTLHEYEIHLYGSLSHSIQDLDLEHLTLADKVKVIEAGRRHGVFGPQRAVVVFRQLLKYIKEIGYPLKFDWRDIELPKTPKNDPKALEPEELDKVRACFNTDTVLGLRTRAWMEVIRGSGLRTSEALSLNRSDINWNKTPVEMSVVNCKTKEKETVYLDDEGAKWLKEYLASRQDRFEPVFVSLNGTRLVRYAANREMRVAIRKLDPFIQKKFFHQTCRVFRKTFITDLLRKTDIKTTQNLARHASPRTTLRHYASADDNRCKNEFQRVKNDGAEMVHETVSIPIHIEACTDDCICRGGSTEVCSMCVIREMPKVSLRPALALELMPT